MVETAEAEDECRETLKSEAWSQTTRSRKALEEREMRNERQIDS